MEYSDLGSFLSERMRERGVTVKRLSELTGISVKHLEALREGRFDQLPSAPYLRGYLMKLGQILEFDANDWWEGLRNARPAKNSAPTDELPKNRFKKEPVKKYIIPGALAIILIFYFGFRFSKIFGQPSITISYPAENVTIVSQDSVSIIGRMTGGDTLKVNFETISAGQNGDWQKTVSLQPGINTIEISAKKFLGRETKIIRQVIYEPPKSSSSSAPAL
ncbi:MAG: helix-turn-helix domain-containing protein [Candidatus Liptonbacteria bacterium]|nr:helix-turn-helix domain-containing protein [Candidatus Liptonbacteria bacterium]